MSSSQKTPVYFISHGGPNLGHQTEHPAYEKLQEIGQEITQKVKPKAVVVFSAHWQGGMDTIEVNTNEITELIYDFYGFPAHYYEQKYPNIGSKAVAEEVIHQLTKSGIKAKGVSRGLDHGIWVSFSVAFNPQSNPLNIPIVQVSLFNNESPDAHFALGRAISSLREQNIQIIVSGMAVHNLRDMWLGDERKTAYAAAFGEALGEAVTTEEVRRREELMRAVLGRGDLRKAHPSLEHLLPLFVGAGAAGGERGRMLFTFVEGSVGWAMFRFGEVEGSIL